MRKVRAKKTGIIDQPYIGERFEGGFGLARLTGPRGERPLATRATAAWRRPRFHHLPRGRHACRTRGVRDRARPSEADALRHGLLRLRPAGRGACGSREIEAGLASYDISAPIAVIEAAGGVVTDWKGRPVHQGGRALAAANPVLHAAALGPAARMCPMA